MDTVEYNDKTNNVPCKRIAEVFRLDALLQRSFGSCYDVLNEMMNMSSVQLEVSEYDSVEETQCILSEYIDVIDSSDEQRDECVMFAKTLEEWIRVGFSVPHTFIEEAFCSYKNATSRVELVEKFLMDLIGEKIVTPFRRTDKYHLSTHTSVDVHRRMVYQLFDNAIESGNLFLLRLLFSSLECILAYMHIDVHENNDRLIFSIIRMDCAEMLELFLANGTPLDYVLDTMDCPVTYYNGEKYTMKRGLFCYKHTLLSYSVFCGSIKCVNMLISKGFCVDNYVVPILLSEIQIAKSNCSNDDIVRISKEMLGIDETVTTETYGAIIQYSHILGLNLQHRNRCGRQITNGVAIFKILLNNSTRVQDAITEYNKTKHDE